MLEDLFFVDEFGKEIFTFNYKMIALHETPTFPDVANKIYEEYNEHLREKQEFFEGIPILQKEFIDYNETQIKVFHFLISHFLHFQTHGKYYCSPQLKVW
jgi:hypothetical protein